jgi:hypothetical protein
MWHAAQHMLLQQEHVRCLLLTAGSATDCSCCQYSFSELDMIVATTLHDWRQQVSMDGCVKLWDRRRGHHHCAGTYRPRSDAARDVQFSPFRPDRFAVAFENGQLQVCTCTHVF